MCDCYGCRRGEAITRYIMPQEIQYICMCAANIASLAVHPGVEILSAGCYLAHLEVGVGVVGGERWQFVVGDKLEIRHAVIVVTVTVNERWRFVVIAVRLTVSVDQRWWWVVVWRR